MERLLCVLIGAAFGNFITAEIVARAHLGHSIRRAGSGNPGTANSIAVMGKAKGALVLAGDLIKTFAACLLCALIFPALARAACLYAGLGVLLGHMFPVWLRLRGGRGVASLCALAAAFSPLLGVCASLLGLAAVIITKYLAMGTLVIALCFALGATVFFGGTETIILSWAAAALCIARSADSYLRIINKTEKTTDILRNFIKKRP